MSEYKPLHELILEGLEEGTVLEAEQGGQAVWSGNLYWKINTVEVKAPFAFQWRVISTPPKKIEFESAVSVEESGICFVYFPVDYREMEPCTRVRVTVEEKR